MITESILDIIGNTPLLNMRKLTGLKIYAKAEFLNPGGSIKDRVAKYMIEQAEFKGLLKPGMTIMEPTSGNTGIGIALVGVQKGYRVVIVMPENMSEERKLMIQALGAELVLTKAEDSIEGAVKEVERLAAEASGIFVPQQFKNEDNPRIHSLETGPEIWRQLEGDIDVFVSGLGSGGSLQGIGQFLKSKNPGIKVVAVEPKGASALLGHKASAHRIQGIGDGFIPDVLDSKLIDHVIEVDDEAAIKMMKAMIRGQGVLAGISSGANLWASVEIARQLGEKKSIVTLLPDRFERYFSVCLEE
ncbi:cysteine synthase A [Acidaminobacter hydrogenoformans]|uniref:Cysteine synthase n=1 Tax=Acidaminobacter hydrogenoformans DSM 2784 TaxID=1120920 RepID=A0A1G5RXT7_9FIRM|nr:cysteine synthase A [Acidaminobacter hydrogenoformans]SCZ78560.1 cysteine synthase A [Acidaminobacter hydrogenoformans DSM 2784]